MAAMWVGCCRVGLRVSSLKILFLCSLILLSILGAHAFRLDSYKRKSHSEPNPALNFTQVQKWFNSQKINHFDKQDNRTYSQRYWYVSDYYKRGGPVFLYICGEYTCPGVNEQRLFPLQQAQQNKALFVVLEHRYYGLSQPFKDFKTSNLVYLTVDQALEDIAYFMHWFKANSEFSLTDSNKWITIGGSYPGAMSAWFRYKYPHLTVGAWASSAVVNAIADFPKYDEQVFISTNKSGIDCPKKIQNLTAYFEYQLYNTTPAEQKAFQARFGKDAEKLTKEELLYFIGDTFAGPIQHGDRTNLCNNVLNETDFNRLVDKVIAWSLEENDPRGCSALYLKNDTFDEKNLDNMRQWTYQVCTEFGWVQSAAAPAVSTRSQRLNVDFFKNFCKEVFGVALWPDTNAKNWRLGGLNLKATNLLMMNGVEDPWKWASLTENRGDISSTVIDCDDCSHCIELHTPTDKDPQALKNARAKVADFLARIL